MQKIILLIILYLGSISVYAQVIDDKHSFDATKYTQQQRPRIKRLGGKSFFDNCLLTAGGGAMLFTNNKYYDSTPYYKAGYVASLRMVKFVNYISGFGLNLTYQAGDYQFLSTHFKPANALTAGGEYLYTLCGRYAFEKPFKVYWSSALHLGYSEAATNKKFIWGGNTGIICDYAFRSGFHILGEVKANVWSDQFDQIRSGRKIDATFSVQAGIGYMF